MLTREQYFPGHAPGEEVALFIRRHWLTFLPWLIFGPVLLILIFSLYLTLWLPADSFLRGSQDSRVVAIVILAILLFSLAFVLLRAWMSYYLEVTIVTERRLVDIVQRGIFVRRISEQSLLRVQDVSARQHGFWNHFFHYGDLYIETAGVQQNFELHNIPWPNEVAKTILDLHDRLVNLGGHEVEVMATEGDLEEPVSSYALPRIKPRHPLEELRPYFPEPGASHPPHPLASQLATEQPVGALPEEGELRDGETVTVPQGSQNNA